MNGANEEGKVVKYLKLFGKIALRVLVILPVPFFVMWLNYVTFEQVEYATFQYERDTAVELFAGEQMLGVDTMDERLVLSLLIENMEEPVDTVAIGSSRVMQMSKEIAGVDSFYNCGVSGADYRDIMNIYYQFEKAGMLPENIIFALDPWILNADPTKLHRQSDPELFEEFITLQLGQETDYVPALPSGVGAAELLDITSFQESVEYLISGGAEEVPPPYVEGDVYNQSSQVKNPDGTVIYPVEYREVDEMTVEHRARTEAGTFLNMDGFMAPSENLQELFRLFIQHVQDNGVNVVFVLMPYHSLVYEYAMENEGLYPGFFMTEPWYTELAQEMNIPLYGSYNPYVTGNFDTDFYDGLHIKEQEIAKFFPGMEQVHRDIESGSLGSPWLSGGPRVSEETAQASVAFRYEVPQNEELILEEEQTINDEVCYVFARYGVVDGAPNTEDDEDAEGTEEDEDAEEDEDDEDAEGTEEDEDAEDVEEVEKIVLARYAVGQDEGTVYRLDDAAGWVVDSRYAQA